MQLGMERRPIGAMSDAQVRLLLRDRAQAQRLSEADGGPRATKGRREEEAAPARVRGEEGEAPARIRQRASEENGHDRPRTSVS